MNPDQTNGGPPSGFITEDGMDTGQTYNVPETLPMDDLYSPLWDVQIYDNADFDDVSDLSTAEMINIMAVDSAIVNCSTVSASNKSFITTEQGIVL